MVRVWPFGKTTELVSFTSSSWPKSKRIPPWSSKGAVANSLSTYRQVPSQSTPAMRSRTLAKSLLVATHWDDLVSDTNPNAGRDSSSSRSAHTNNAAEIIRQNLSIVFLQSDATSNGRTLLLVESNRVFCQPQVVAYPVVPLENPKIN